MTKAAFDRRYRLHHDGQALAIIDTATGRRLSRHCDTATRQTWATMRQHCES